MQLRHMQYKTGKFVADNSPTLLTAIGITGLVATAVLTGKATFRAVEFLEEETKLLHQNTQQGYIKQTHKELTPKEKVQVTWKLYIPAAVAGSLSIAAVIGANRVGSRRAAAVTAAYAISERAYGEYKSKVIEHIGTSTEQKLRDEIMQDRVDRHPLGEQQAIDTGGGKDLCYDSWNGRYFWCSMEAIKQAQNRINYKINHQFYASLTDFYDYLGLDRTKLSDDFGWNSSEQLELTFTTTFSDKGQPVLVMDFLLHPIRGYERAHG